MKIFQLLNFLFLIQVLSAQAQWTNRYPKVQDHGGHIYLEGFELPILTSGPMDPAPAPDNATECRGWTASRALTWSAACCSSPNSTNVAEMIILDTEKPGARSIERWICSRASLRRPNKK